MRSRRRTVVAVAGFSCFAFASFFCGWSACEDRVRHGGGRLPRSGGHPIGPGPKGSTGIRPVQMLGAEATMKRAVTAEWEGTARFESSPPK